MSHERPRAAHERSAMRDAVKTAIQVAQDSEGRLLYVIPVGAAGMYADAVMRVLDACQWGPLTTSQEKT